MNWWMGLTLLLTFGISELSAQESDIQGIPREVLLREMENFQRDADVIRLRHLVYYGELIEAYHAAAGHYPFQGFNDKPVYVFFAHGEQIAYVGPPGVPHVQVSFKDFMNNLEQVLGQEIDELYDPQFVPLNKPNFYGYLITGSTFQFGLSVHQDMPFARQISENHFRITLSNQRNASQKTTTITELKNNPAFQAELGRSVSNEEFFKDRENQFRNYTDSIEDSN